MPCIYEINIMRIAQRYTDVFYCIQIAVPLQKQTNKKIDSEQVREGNVKRTQNEENEIDLETSIYKHLKFS